VFAFKFKFIFGVYEWGRKELMMIEMRLITKEPRELIVFKKEKSIKSI